MEEHKLTRRVFAKHVATVTSAAFLMPGFTVNIISKPALSDEVIGHGAFRYRVHKDWGTLDPGTTPVNNCHEMVQDAKGRLIMIGDEVKNNILIYDKSGKLLDTWGAEFPYGHGLTLWDAGGEEFLFLCDNGFDGNPQLRALRNQLVMVKQQILEADRRILVWHRALMCCSAVPR